MTVDSILKNNLFEENFKAIQREYPLLAIDISNWMRDEQNLDLLQHNIDDISSNVEVERFTFNEQAVKQPEWFFYMAWMLIIF